MVGVVRCSVVGVCCLLLFVVFVGVCCLLCVVLFSRVLVARCWLLFDAVCRVSFVVCGLLHCCSLSCSLLVVGCLSLFVGYCLLLPVC